METSSTNIPLQTLRPEEKMHLIKEKFSPGQIKDLFESSQKQCLKYLKNLWSVSDIENHCGLAGIDLQTIHQTEVLPVPKNLDAQCSQCVTKQISTLEKLMLAYYDTAMNQFEDTIIK